MNFRIIVVNAALQFHWPLVPFSWGWSLGMKLILTAAGTHEQTNYMQD